MQGKFGLIGKNISISLSPRIHSGFFDYEYKLFDLDESEAVAKLRKRDFDGLNVTIPYKKTVMPYLDFIDEKAKQIGSVNTVVNKNGVLYGYNTDYYGFMKTLEAIGFNPNNKKALVLGSGGASLSVKQALRDLGAQSVITVSRSGENNYGNISKHFDASVIVNTTPVGKYPDNGNKPLSLDGFEKLEAVADINYNPVKSALLIEAEKMGAKVSGGLKMLVFQAKQSAELFTGERVSEEKAQKTENEILSEMKNIVFIGMPSSGKTTVGKIVAQKLGRAFSDTDEAVETEYGRSPAEIITADGEEEFRRLETEQIKKAAKNTGTVISVGGGAILREKNMDFLKQNGVIVYLERPLCELTGEGRPLSKNIEALFEKRKPLYEKYAFITVKSQATPEKTADEVIGRL